jgi:hypothetical protein
MPINRFIIRIECARSVFGVNLQDRLFSMNRVGETWLILYPYAVYYCMLMTWSLACRASGIVGHLFPWHCFLSGERYIERCSRLLRNAMFKPNLVTLCMQCKDAAVCSVRAVVMCTVRAVMILHQSGTCRSLQYSTYTRAEQLASFVISLS